MSEFKPSIVNIAEICAQKQVLNFILSPGSRSAPLSLALLRHPQLTCRTMVDERSAAFIALGLAQQTERPVGLVSTSGTAALNYYPAVAEAYYQQIPLLIFTADRPPEWLDQNDGQTVHQRELFGKHCLGSFELPVDDFHPDARWHVERLISEAINLTLWPVPGPVHINVPLREPLYPRKEITYNREVKIISVASTQKILEEKIRDELAAAWQTSQKKLVVAGMHQPNPRLAAHLRKLLSDPSAAAVFDVTANLHEALELHHADMILGSEHAETLRQLKPDLLVSFGGPVVSKNLKTFLRNHKPPAHWHIQPHGDCIDTFQSLTQIVPVTPEYFFENLLQILPKGDTSSGKDYAGAWRRSEVKAANSLRAFLHEAPHCEFTAIHSVLKALPRDSRLQLGNSGIVRFASFLGLAGTRDVKVNSNRGTSGIDGTVSTAVGAALATSNMTTLITGDLAFFYDRNALWHNYLPANLRIVVINNYGGGIFRILDGASELPELTQHFEVEHRLTARNTAADHGLDYMFCDSAQSLAVALPKFFDPKDQPAIIEIHTDKTVNRETFLKFKSIMREIS